MNPYQLTGTVEAVLVASDPHSLVSRRVQKIKLIRDHGVKGDNHAGTRLADVREKELRRLGLPKGMEVSNNRAVSLVSYEELLEIDDAMNLPPSVPYGLLGENIVVSGIPVFSKLPIGTMLFFRRLGTKVMRTAIISVWRENTPCDLPESEIKDAFPGVEFREPFVAASVNRRGVVGSAYASGFIHEGDEVIAVIPRQAIYSFKQS